MWAIYYRSRIAFTNPQRVLFASLSHYSRLQITVANHVASNRGDQRVASRFPVVQYRLCTIEISCLSEATSFYSSFSSALER